MSKKLRLPFAVSKSKLQSLFLNDGGQAVSRGTFRARSGLRDFCKESLHITEDEYRRRKYFFGHEVDAILQRYQIEREDLFE
jgi:RNA processing factor Prp31